MKETDQIKIELTDPSWLTYAEEAFLLRENRRNIANKLLENHKKYWLLTLILSLTAACFFAINISFKIETNWSRILGILEFLFFVVAIIVFLFVEGRKMKKNRILARRDSEVLRPIIAFAKGGIKPKLLYSISLQKDLLTQKVLDMVEKAESLPKLKPINLTLLSQELLYLIQGQINYHTKTYKKWKPRKTVLDALQIILFISVIFLSFDQFLSLFEKQIIDLENFKSISIFLGLFIPFTVGAIEAFIYFTNIRRNVIESKHMLEYFETKKSILKELKTEYEIIEFAHELRQRMDEENLDWCIATQSNANSKI